MSEKMLPQKAESKEKDIPDFTLEDLKLIRERSGVASAIEMAERVRDYLQKVVNDTEWAMKNPGTLVSKEHWSREYVAFKERVSEIEAFITDLQKE